MSESTQPEPDFDDDGGKDTPLDRDLFADNCILALQLFVVGERSTPVLAHIDRCAMCSALIHGKPGTPLKTSLLEDLEHRMIMKAAEAKNEGRVPPSREVLEHGLSQELAESRVGFRELEAVVRDGLAGKPRSTGVENRRRAQIKKQFEEQAPIGDGTKRIISRRTWLKVAATVVAAGVLVWKLPTNVESQRNPRATNTGFTVTPGRAQMHAQFDSIYAGSNSTAIQTWMTTASAAQLADLFDWIAERRIVGLYPDVIGALIDPRVEVRRAAVGHLLLVPPLPLKPHLALIQSARIGETNLSLQKGLDRLIKVVSKS